MRTLHLLRHAKSSWKDGSLEDWQRPLNKRGRRNSRGMYPHLVAAGCEFNHCFVSSATRAVQTIENMLDGRGLTAHYQVSSALYTFKAACLLNWIRALPDAHQSVTILGHNPALNDLTNHLCASDIGNIVTMGYVQIKLNTPSWSTLGHGSGSVIQHIYPKMFD